jgi:two-component system catabolic regulation response regulator CreB
MQQILIIEDEAPIADTLIYALQTEGFQVQWCRLGRDGMEVLERDPIDLVVLDVGLPDTNGFELCKAIRRFSEVPVIFLTARGDEVDRIVGLEIGADDYIVKPFSPREVAARVKAILKRTKPAPAVPAVHGFELDTGRARIRYQGRLLELTRYEYLILKTLLEQPERVFSRDQIMDRVWQEPGASLDRAVDTHIKTLRAKLHRVSPDQDPIRTHRGLGYSICAPVRDL